nr:hypothetical protein [Angustibacter aerolatus]
MSDDKPRWRRPAFLAPSALDSLDGDPDPAALAEAAHSTASAIVAAGRGADDPEITARLVRLVDDHGLDTIADLWAGRPARSLPGALWRLYVVREWVRRDAVGASVDYRSGQQVAEVSDVVAGVAQPPAPRRCARLADAVLTGVYTGDLDVALERCAAFCRVVAAGRALRADDVSDLEAGEPHPPRRLPAAHRRGPRGSRPSLASPRPHVNERARTGPADRRPSGPSDPGRHVFRRSGSGGKTDVKEAVRARSPRGEQPSRPSSVWTE